MNERAYSTLTYSQVPHLLRLPEDGRVGAVQQQCIAELSSLAREGHHKFRAV